MAPQVRKYWQQRRVPDNTRTDRTRETTAPSDGGKQGGPNEHPHDRVDEETRDGERLWYWVRPRWRYQHHDQDGDYQEKSNSWCGSSHLTSIRFS